MPNYSGKWTPSQVLQARGQDLWPINGPFFYVDDVFSTYLYDGNGSTQTITNGIDLSGEGGLVWTRWRSGYYTSRDHNLFDTERGTTAYLNTNNTSAEKTPYPNAITYNSNGFTLNNQFPSNMSFGGETFVSWTFRKQAGFFDVVTYTGDGTSSRQISHNLGSSPGVIIVKKTNSSIDSYWMVYHRDSPENTATTPNQTKNLVLQSTAAIANNNCFGAHSTQTDSYFTLGTANLAHVNGSGNTYVAYVFAHDDQRFGDNQNESIIKCGSFAHNYSGATVNLGWEPQWILVKAADQAVNWYIFDVMRGIVTGGLSGDGDAALFPNTSGAENVNTWGIDVNATGFTVYGNNILSSGDAIYIAIRRPMKTPEAATDVFSPQLGTASGEPRFVSGFPTDLLIKTYRYGYLGSLFGSRLTGNKYMSAASTAAESTDGAFFKFDYQNGTSTSGDSNDIGWMFKRAPGFMDVVAYSGTGATGQVESHNLGAVPEMIIVKNRGSAWQWAVYHKDLGEYDSGSYIASKNLTLNTTDAETTNCVFSQHSDQTASVFTLGYTNSAITYASGNNYVAYLFATLAGVSKVGSYTGTAANLDVDCGFTSGARFILIKRTDSTGDWYVYDSLRGITSGNDPYLLINSSAAEVTSTDYIDPLSSGFTVTSSAPAGLNASGGEYIFLAIA